MLKAYRLKLSLNKKLVLMMLFLSFIQISVLLFLYSQAEEDLFHAIETQTGELTGAIQIGVRQLTASGTTDEARLSDYLKELNAKGVKEISIISNANEVVASTNPSKVGQALTHRKRDLIIKAELGQRVSEEGRAYNIILPVIAGDTQYGYLHLKVNKDDFSSLLRASAAKRIGATILVFAIGIVMSVVFSRQYTRPIRKVGEAAMRVAAGDLDQHIPIQRNDEIGQMAEGFNFMVKKLQDNRALEKRLREAEHLSGLGQLSRHVAHEIRNPLNFISLSIDHIRDKYGPAEGESREKFTTLVGGIKQEIERLNRLVNDFINYSRPIRLNIQGVRIQEPLDDVVSLIRAKAEADGVTLTTEYRAPATLCLCIDADLFKSCVLNVISNAFYSMKKTSRRILHLATEVLDDQFVLLVRDSGEGVAPENISRIFEPFFSTKENGLGLGLPMTKKIIEEHGGDVAFSCLPGKGSQVKLSLPLRGEKDTATNMT